MPREARETTGARGPLGVLPGLAYDPIKNRYFPIRADEDPKPTNKEEQTSVRRKLEEQKERTEKRTKRGKRVESAEVKSGNGVKVGARIDRTLLRATGLQLGYDRFSGPTSAEAQRRMR